MIALAPAAVGLLTVVAASIVTRVLIGIGIGIVSYIGFAVVLDFIITNITASFNTLPAKVLALASMMQLDVAVNIILGCINARLGVITFGGMMSRFQITPGA
jgi:hypothetical protein